MPDNKLLTTQLILDCFQYLRHRSLHEEYGKLFLLGQLDHRKVSITVNRSILNSDNTVVNCFMFKLEQHEMGSVELTNSDPLYYKVIAAVKVEYNRHQQRMNAELEQLTEQLAQIRQYNISKI